MTARQSASGDAMLRHLARALPAGHSLRPRTEGDLPFLRDLYAQSRMDELVAVPWDARLKRAFLDDQFGKQHAHYLQHYPTAQWGVITRDGAPVGRLYVARTASDVRVMDVTLDAALRNRGIGTALMRALLRQADAQGVPASLHVEPFNPAIRLYRRLGFAHVETRGVYHFMQRAPSAPASVPVLASVEDDLVAHVGRVPADRDHEQLQPAESGM